MKTLLAFFAFLFLTTSVFTQSVKIVQHDGTEIDIKSETRPFRNRGVVIDNGDLINYEDISYIGTDDINAYEKALNKTNGDFEKLNIAFTGDKNV